jgi:hypothetical protein
MMFRTGFGAISTRIWVAASLVAATLLFGMSAPATAQVADAVIEVLAQDESQAVLPGVTVTVLRPDTGYTQNAVTDQAGTARFIALQPGIYTVKVELAGFTTVNQEGVTLRVGQTARLTTTLKVAKVAETVNVVAVAPLVDVYKTDSSTNIIPEQINELPVPNRDFQQLAFLAPGVQRERGGFRFISNQPVLGAGGNASQSTILVDGVDFTDQTLGLARARFSQDAISEFRVITNRFDTEIGGSAGGALSIVTKSGTNNLHGSGFGFFRDDALRSQGALDKQKNPYSRQQFGGTIGGPITVDRTHFFGSVEQVNEDNIALFRPQGAFTSLAKDITVPVRQTLFYAGVDHRINDKQNFRGKFMYERYRQANFRVGGVADESDGMRLDRDNWNFTFTHAWTVSNSSLNQLSVQVGQRKYVEPNNSTALMESFSVGNTLSTGSNYVGDQNDTGKIFEVRDTFFTRIGSGTWAQDIKFGGALQYVKDTWNFPLYPKGWMIYLNDTRLFPYLYIYGKGASESTISTNLVSFFAQDDLRPSPRVTINLGLRYDLDTNGNNPTFTSPAMTAARGRDMNNFQPRIGFSWDASGNGQQVVRGGIGLFTGRFLLVPAHSELQRNSYSGYITQQRVNGALIGVPILALDPNNPQNTGIALPYDVTHIDKRLVNPYATQATAGYAVRLGNTGLFADFEGIYVKGNDEIVLQDQNWAGNGVAGGRPDKTRNYIDTYTNKGRSEYKAFVASINGTIKGGHIVSASFTVADKKNIEDDFSPAITDYPNDPANLEAEWGRSRGDERYRFVASAVMRLPARFTFAPIFSYGSGQPWNHRLGYDANGDGRNSDRPAGMARFSEKGPNFAVFDMRLTYKLPLGSRSNIDLIAEVFNLLNRTNYDVNFLQNNEYLSGPTPTAPAAALVPNPNFKTYTATLPPREAQLGVRWTF